MSDDEEELGLAPQDDEDLQLVPVDDEAEKRIAPEISYKEAAAAGIRLIPVVCTACNTRLYVGENQVGLWKRCPVCVRLNKIHPVDPKFMLVADDPEAEDGYEIGLPEISKREMFRINADYRTLSGEVEPDSETDYFPDPISGQKKPLMDRVLDNFLKSNEEKDEERQAAERKSKIEEELQGIRKAVREGKLEEHLALKEGDDRVSSDPAERKRAAKQRAFEIAASDPLKQRTAPISTPTSSPPSGSPAKQNEAEAVFAALDAALATVEKTPERTAEKTVQKTASTPTDSDRSLWSPLFDPRCRNRMMILIVFGLIGNLFGEKARSMIWQVLVDRVYGQSPGYSYNFQENILLLSSFWVGGVLTAVWLALLFLYGISLFQATARGSDRVRDWIPFDLDFGFSYIGWTLLIVYFSSVPGQLLWFFTDISTPQLAAWTLVLQPLLLFLIFPVLFLCIIESDTFFGAFPSKTLGSLRRRPGIWLRFYGSAVVYFGIPSAAVVGFGLLGMAFDEHRIMQSGLYYLVASVFLTVAGFAVLLYFRLLGKLMHEIRKEG